MISSLPTDDETIELPEHLDSVIAPVGSLPTDSDIRTSDLVAEDGVLFLTSAGSVVSFTSGLLSTIDIG